MPDPVSITALANLALDRAYAKASGTMFVQIKALTTAPSSALQRVLRELDEEAARLEQDDKKMTPDNAVLEKALRESEQTIRTTQTLIQANDNNIEESGAALAIPVVTAKVFTGITQALYKRGIDPLTALNEYRKQLQRSNIKWNTPGALDFATKYVDSDAWASKMEGWGAGYAKLTRETMLDGVRKGWGPRYTAAQLRRYAQGIPTHAAENLTRTLQLTSYRDASAAMESVNGQYIEGKIRIASLDGRTCLSCIALHGTKLAAGERVDDHYRGRCTEFYQVIGGPRFPDAIQADSTPGNRRFVPYQSGPEWFNSLPENRQKQQVSFMKSPAKWRAFKDGTQLQEFIGEHIDDVFGHQFIEKSLIRTVGDRALYYYTLQPLEEMFIDTGTGAAELVEQRKEWIDGVLKFRE